MMQVTTLLYSELGTNFLSSPSRDKLINFLISFRFCSEKSRPMVEFTSL